MSSFNFIRYLEPALCGMDVVVPSIPTYAPFNYAAFIKFLDNVKNGTPDSVRVVQYGIEGQVIIKNIFFDGKIITCIFDSTKGDTMYGKGSINKYEGNNIKKEDNINITRYSLMNNDELVTVILSFRKPPY